MRQMVLVGFLQAQNCTNLASSWRHPQSRTDSWSPDFYRHIGRVLEAGKFHLGFFDDRLSMPDMYGRNHAHTVEHGIRCVKLDAVTVLTVMAMAAERPGMSSLRSTTAKPRIWGATKSSGMMHATIAPTSSWKSCSGIGTPGK